MGAPLNPPLASKIARILSAITTYYSPSLTPLVKAHSVDGSSNDAMDVLIRCPTRSAATPSLPCLVPYRRKGGDLDTEGAICSAAPPRWSTAPASPRHAADDRGRGQGLRHGEDGARPSLRMVDIKSNMAPKAQATDWNQLVPVKLGNDSVEPAYPFGDSVQAIRRWNPPELFGGMDHPTMAAIFADLGDACPGLVGGSRPTATVGRGQHRPPRR